MGFAHTFKRKSLKPKQNKTRHSGGKSQFVGKGSYGCTYRPTFTCALPPLNPYASPEEAAKRNALIKRRKSHAGKIGKLTSQKEAKKEMQIAEALRTIDPDQNLLLYGLDSCSIDVSELRLPDGSYSDEIKRCINGPRSPLRPNTPETAVQVFMKYGGKDLYNLERNLAVDAPQLLESMLRLFDGLTLLHDRHIVHLDFKIQNTVLRRESGLYKPYIIDFGFLTNTSKIYTHNLNWAAIYPAYPPEIALLDMSFISPEARKITQKIEPGTSITSFTYTQTKRTIIGKFVNIHLAKDFVNGLENLKSAGLSYSLFRKPDGTPVIDEVYLQYMYDLTNFLFIESNEKQASRDLKDWLNIDYDELRAWFSRFDTVDEPFDKKTYHITTHTVWKFFDKFLKGIDAYSLGLVLASVWFRIFGIRININSSGGKIWQLYDKDYKLINVDQLNYELKTFIPGFIKTIIEPMNEIINGLMNFNFTKRLTIREARAKYVELLPNLKIWCSKPAYESMLVAMKIIDDVPVH
jgi:serine/threonine protein kinase